MNDIGWSVCLGECHQFKSCIWWPNIQQNSSGLFIICIKRLQNHIYKVYPHYFHFHLNETRKQRTAFKYLEYWNYWISVDWIFDIVPYMIGYLDYSINIIMWEIQLNSNENSFFSLLVSVYDIIHASIHFVT